MNEALGIRRYQETEIASIGPEKLIVLLYEALRRHLKQTKERILAHDPVAANQHLDSAQAIVSELRAALDHNIGGEIADNLALHEMDSARLLDLKKQAAGQEIDLEVGARSMRPELLEQYIGIAETLESPLLRFVIDGPGFAPDVDEVIWILKGVIPELEQKGIRLAIENHDRLKARDFLRIIEETESPCVGICLDSVTSMGAGEGIETITSILAPHTFNLHIKEFLVERHPHMMGFTIEGRPVGQGQLPLAWMLRQLGPQCESAILESWTPPEAKLEDTLVKEQAWAKESIKYLKSTYFK